MNPMQAVILAAGRGTRMGTLTDALPKPMLTVAGKTLLEHKFDILGPEFHELIIVIGYQGELIRSTYGDLYKGMPIRYVMQETLDGTMGALALARTHLEERFVVMMGDDIYSTDDITCAVAVPDWAMLLKDMEHMASGGRIITDTGGAVIAIEEGDHRGQPGLFNTNMFVLDPRVFDYPMIPKAAGSSEYGLPQTVLAASKASGISLQSVLTTDWIQITAPEDIVRAEMLIEDTAPAV
jgi:NDP-sugar pyrophosphorylase family protein